MRRIPVLVGVALVAALALGACDAQFTPYAARVDGAAVSQSTLDAALDSVAADPGYRCLVESASGGATSVVGVARGTYNATFAADALSLLIEADAIHVAVGRFRLAEGPVAMGLAESEMESDFTPQSGSTCQTTGGEVLAALSGGFRSALVQLQADEDALAARVVGASLSNAGIANYERHHRAATTLDCTWAIELASQTKAEQFATAIYGGVAFAKIARKNSLDASSASKGGYLGCILPSDLTSPLGGVVRRLPVGKLSSPVHFQKYWLLLKVTRRPVAPLKQAAAAVINAGRTAAAKQLSAIVGAAHVSVDPTYGTWAKVSGTWEVRAPAGPPVDLVPNPAAVGAKSALGG
ncbi:MAG: peptidylprolyl isomerase [Acidimicrobiales bacterium]